MKRAAGTVVGLPGSGGLLQPLLRDLLAVDVDELALPDRIPGRQRALLEHPQWAALALLLRDAALRLGEFAHVRLAHEGHPNLGQPYLARCRWHRAVVTAHQ